MSGRSSRRPRPSRSHSCRTIPVQALAAIASRWCPSICRQPRANMACWASSYPPRIASVELDPIDLGVMDAVVLLTPHTGIDYDRIIRAAPLVIDTHSGLTPREAANVVNIWVPEALAATPALS